MVLESFEQHITYNLLVNRRKQVFLVSKMMPPEICVPLTM